MMRDITFEVVLCDAMGLQVSTDQILFSAASGQSLRRI